MLEISGAFGALISKWRPRRTLMFCAWDAEEYSLIGSTEFVEEFQKLLNARAVAYLNVDLIPGNQTLYMDSVPLLYQVQPAAIFVQRLSVSMLQALKDAAMVVPNPSSKEREQGRPTVFHTWLYNQPPKPEYREVSLR